MMIHDLVGKTLTLYLLGGHVFTGTVRNITVMEYSESNGTIGKYSVLVIDHHMNTTMIRVDMVASYEIH